MSPRFFGPGFFLGNTTVCVSMVQVYTQPFFLYNNYVSHYNKI